jgi:Fuseless
MAHFNATHRVLRPHFRSLASRRIRRKRTATEASPFVACDNINTVAFHVFVGMCAASFWRGSWYILDDLLYPNQKEISAVSSLLLGASGMVCVQGLIHRAESLTVGMYNRYLLSTHQARAVHSVLRFGAIYSLVLSVVCIWRGTWMSWDLLYAKYYNSQLDQDSLETVPNSDNPERCSEVVTIHASDPGHALRSGLLSHCGAVVALCSLGIFSSVFAPPAAVSIIRDRTVFSTRTSIRFLLYGKGNGATSTALKKSHLLSKHVQCPERKRHGNLSRHRVSTYS